MNKGPEKPWTWKKLVIENDLFQAIGNQTKKLVNSFVKTMINWLKLRPVCRLGTAVPIY